MRENSKGFTLVEAMITVIFFSLIVGACFLLSKVGNESWQVNSVRIGLAQENRKALDWLMNELRQSGASTISNVPADGSWYNTISFKMATGITSGKASWGDEVTYAIGGVNNDQLIRTQSGQERVIAHDFNTIQFKRLPATPDIVEVAINVKRRTARANQELDLGSNFKIKMRND